MTIPGSRDRGAWPLFFDHTRHEAERWVRRLNDLARGETDFERAEVVKFWTNIMDEHARFIAHLLDPDEFELIEKACHTHGALSLARIGQLCSILEVSGGVPDSGPLQGD